MKYALTGKMSKYLDNYTIQTMQVPSLVLMEKAALMVAQKAALKAAVFSKKARILAVCGCGNNGADGIAAARILSWQGIKTDILIVGNEEHATEEFVTQKNIALNSNMTFALENSIAEYDIIIDAIFGIGLSRNVEGRYKEIIDSINKSDAYIISVDTPSGINTDTGMVMGVAVNANETVTFGYNKTGIMLGNGLLCAGKVTVADIGFAPDIINEREADIYFTKEDIALIPERLATANKGTYGRTLVIAGSEEMSGAAFLSGAAAYRCGCGIVEIFTHKNTAPVIRNLLPEAIVTEYDDTNAIDRLEKILDKADYIVLGSGLSQCELSQNIVKYVLDNAKVPMVLDADALNIVSKNLTLLKLYKSTVIITPHIGEMARLTGIDVGAIKPDIRTVAQDFAREYGVICALKDYVSVVAEPEGCVYINTSGSAAMSKGGSGDVLTGVIAGMLAVGFSPFYAAAMGEYVHGLAGEAAAENRGSHTVIASDMLDQFGKILSK